MKEVRCLFRDGYEAGPVVAVQDCFGKCYRRFFRKHQEGEVLASRVMSEHARFTVREDGSSPVHSKVLAAVHHNTIYAVLRRTGNGHLRLDSGYWYEVHSD